MLLKKKHLGIQVLNKIIFGKSIALHLGVLFFVLFSIVSATTLLEYYNNSLNNLKVKQKEELERRETIVELILEQEEERIKAIIDSYTSKLTMINDSNNLLFEDSQANLDLFFIKSTGNGAIINLSYSIYNTDEIVEKIGIIDKDEGYKFLYTYIENTFYCLLVYSSEIVDMNTGRVTGYAYGGTILNENLDFVERIREKLNSDYIGLSIFDEIIVSASSKRFEEVGFNIDGFLKENGYKKEYRNYIITKNNTFEFNKTPLILVSAFEDTISPSIKKDFIQLSVFMVLSLFVAIVLVVLFAKKIILSPLQDLVNLFEHYNDKDFNISKKKIGIKEFDVIKVQLVNLVERISESKNFVSQVLDGAPIGIYHKNLNGKVEGCNRSFLKIFDYKDTEEVVGKNIGELFKNSSKELIEKQDEEIFAEPFHTYSFRKSEVTSTNKKRELLVYKRALFNHNKEIIGIVGAILDITEEIKLQKDLEISQKELIELNRNLEDKVREEVERRLTLEKERQKNQDLLFQQSKMASMGEMISSIAHQWKQPLNTLNVLVQNIQDSYEYNELDEETIKTIVSSSKKQVGYMSKTIDDFRNFFKPTKEKKEFVLFETIKDTVGIIEYQLLKSNIEVEIKGDLSLSIYGIANEFMQVIINILNNAKDNFIEKGGYSNKIVIEISQSESKKVISIKDNGGGIDEDFLPKVFKAYESSKGDKGTGLGLYMSKLIIEESFQGKIKARNSEIGAEFIITI